MMNLLSPWRRHNDYASLMTRQSSQFPGVTYAIRKMSLGQRIKLVSRAREMSLKNEFLRAGDVTDQLDAAAADFLVQRLYLEWAATEIRGLRIDGKPATIELLIEKGPEALVSEISCAIRELLELSDSERKNS